MNTHLARVTLAKSLVRLGAARNAHHSAGDNLAVFREINRLASEGKWDNLNNKPKLFLCGAAKEDAYRVFAQFNKEEGFFDQSAYGVYLKVVFRLVAYFGTLYLGHTIYEMVVPEENRLLYKYRNKHHGHGEEHH